MKYNDLDQTQIKATLAAILAISTAFLLGAVSAMAPTVRMSILLFCGVEFFIISFLVHLFRSNKTPLPPKPYPKWLFIIAVTIAVSMPLLVLYVISLNNKNNECRPDPSSYPIVILDSMSNN